MQNELTLDVRFWDSHERKIFDGRFGSCARDLSQSFVNINLLIFEMNFSSQVKKKNFSKNSLVETS